jgi:hypothetical protein
MTVFVRLVFPIENLPFRMVVVLDFTWGENIYGGY